MKPKSLEQLKAWLRAELGSSRQSLGKGYQASIDLYESPFGNFAVKRAHGNVLFRRLREAAIRREHNIYQYLLDIPGIPKCLGLIDEKYLILEHLPGKTFRKYEKKLQNREQFFKKLLATVKAMHQAGVAHGDLKRKDNILVGLDDSPYVIDFGTAHLRKKPYNWWNQLVFKRIAQADYNAWIKLKYQRRFVDLSPADAELYYPLFEERLARVLRIVWQKLTLRRLRVRFSVRKKN
ncbi:MAG: RIO1 family regulatory kinase/ATPase [Gammaproteobacteria bacterium]